MRVFLTGATGYIGTAVAERLGAAGHEITALARSDASAGKLKSAGIQPVRGDFSDPKSVGSAARAADGVISLAATYDPSIDGWVRMPMRWCWISRRRDGGPRSY